MIEIPIIEWMGKFHYGVHKRLPLVCVLSQMNQVHILPSYFSVTFKYFKDNQTEEDEVGRD